MVRVTNKDSLHFNKKGKVHERIMEEDKVLVYIHKDEAIYEFKSSEISTDASKKKMQIPKTRKKFYEYIQSDSNSREDITSLINSMIQKKCMKIESKKNFVNSFVVDSNNSRMDIVQQIRKWRDENKISFLKHLAKKSRYSNSMHY